MRIALDLSGIDEHTGVRVYAVQLLREYLAADCDHEFYVIMRSRDVATYPTHGRNFKVVSIPSRAESAIANIAWHWSGFSSLLRKLNIDLIHQLDCNRVFPIKGSIALVVTVHGLIDPSVPGRRHFLRQRYNATIVPHLLSLATKVISVSHNTRQDLLRYTAVNKQHITVIHEGCALQGKEGLETPAAVALLTRKYGLKEPYILYVARLEHPNKNHIALLKAYKSLQGGGVPLPRLVFVGADSYRAESVRRAVEHLSLQEHVTFAGFVPDADLPAFYRCASVYACPTLYEGFGLPLLEAMQFGVPIICSNSSSLPELVGTAALKFDPLNVSEISEALKIAIYDRERRAVLVKNGFAQLASFSAPEMARNTLKVYEDAVKRRKGVSEDSLPLGPKA